MTFEDIKAYYGSVAKAQADLGIKARQTIYDWKKRGVPSGWQAKIQLKTAGKPGLNGYPPLKADEGALAS